MSFDPTGAQRQTAELDRKRKIKREREMGDLRSVLNTAEGRRVLWRILSQAQVFTASYTGDQDTFFNEGKRNIGIWMLEELMQAKPEAFLQMQREAHAESKKEEAQG